jgi:hypothetical protein
MVINNDPSVDHLMSRASLDAALAAVVAGLLHEFPIFFVDRIVISVHDCLRQVASVVEQDR